MSLGQSAKWRESHSSTCRTYIYFLDDEGLAISKQSQAIVSYSSAMPLPLNDSPLRPNYIEDFDITLDGPSVWGGVRHRADRILEADSN